MGPERRDLGPDWKNLNLSHSATLHNSTSQFIYLFIYSAAKSRKRQQQTTNNTTNSITKKNNNIQYAYTTRHNHDRSHSNKHLPPPPHHPPSTPRHPLLPRHPPPLHPLLLHPLLLHPSPLFLWASNCNQLSSTTDSTHSSTQQHTQEHTTHTTNNTWKSNHSYRSKIMQNDDNDRTCHTETTGLFYFLYLITPHESDTEENLDPRI